MAGDVSDPLVGQVIDGRYQVRARLARGGMATVYDATDLRLDRRVAVKVMHRHLAEDPDFVQRFQREARSAARLAHPHVVGVFDQGAVDDLVYLVMEYVPSRTLRDVIRDFGPLRPEQALVILEPVLEGLAAAHAAGFVHRDVKPENVLIADDGRVKVADFGLARAVATSNTSTTQGMIIGTVAYLSPEQVERGEADGRSDVYSAGILLFEMITGRTPYAAESPLSVAYQHVNNDVPAPSSIVPGLAPDVDALVARATRRDPDLRYANAVDFLNDVRRVRTVLPAPRPFTQMRDTLVVDASTAARLAAATPRAEASPAPPAPADAVPVEQVRRGRGRLIVIVAAVVAAVALAAFGGWLVTAGRSVPIPDVVGQSVEQASTTLTAAGFIAVVGGEAFSEDIAVGLVAATDPLAADGAREGSEITLLTSRGPERYTVPDVRGSTPAEATTALQGANLVAGATSEVFHDTVPSGKVAATDPEIGAPLKRDTSVDLLVSKGPKPVTLPDVVGRKASRAESTLADLGIVVKSSGEYSEQIPKGEVMSMKPAAGTTVNSGSTVTLVASKGPPPVVVPNLIDMPKSKAIAALRKVGLKARVVEGAATPLKRVYSQDPSPGSELPKGSTVTIRII